MVGRLPNPMLPGCRAVEARGCYMNGRQAVKGSCTGVMSIHYDYPGAPRPNPCQPRVNNRCPLDLVTASSVSSTLNWRIIQREGGAPSGRPNQLGRRPRQRLTVPTPLSLVADLDRNTEEAILTDCSRIKRSDQENSLWSSALAPCPMSSVGQV